MKKSSPQIPANSTSSEHDSDEVVLTNQGQIDGNELSKAKKVYTSAPTVIILPYDVQNEEVAEEFLKELQKQSKPNPLNAKIPGVDIRQMKLLNFPDVSEERDDAGNLLAIPIITTAEVQTFWNHCTSAETCFNKDPEIAKGLITSIDRLEPEKMSCQNHPDSVVEDLWLPVPGEILETSLLSKMVRYVESDTVNQELEKAPRQEWEASKAGARTGDGLRDMVAKLWFLVAVMSLIIHKNHPSMCLYFLRVLKAGKQYKPQADAQNVEHSLLTGNTKLYKRISDAMFWLQTSYGRFIPFNLDGYSQKHLFRSGPLTVRIQINVLSPSLKNADQKLNPSLPLRRCLQVSSSMPLQLPQSEGPSLKLSRAKESVKKPEESEYSSEEGRLGKRQPSFHGRDLPDRSSDMEASPPSRRPGEGLDGYFATLLQQEDDEDRYQEQNEFALPDNWDI